MQKLFTFFAVLFIINFAKAQWKSTTGPYLASQYIGMTVDEVAVSGNNLCAVMQSRIYLSNNNGASWMFASNGVNSTTSMAFKDSIIYTGGTGGMYYSSNWGSTYKTINTNLPPNFQTRDVLINGNSVFALIYNSANNDNDIYYSTDNGNTWTLSNGIHNKYAQRLATNGTNIYAAASYGGVYMSTDNGHNWVSIGPASSTSIDRIGVNGNKIFAGESDSEGYLFFSTNNGASWTQVNTGLSPYISSIAFINNDVFVATYFNGIYRSSNNGTSWNSMGGNPCGYSNIQSMVASGNNLYIGSQDGFTASANQDSSWNCNPLKTYDLNINSIVSKGANVVTATAYGIYNSPDAGLTWHRFLYNENALAMNDSIVLAGGSSGSLFRSGDFGNSWLSYNVLGNPTIRDLVFKDSLVFAATSDSGMYFSSNYGHSWSMINAGLTDLTINKVACSDSIIVAGSNSKGIFVSTDLGLNWHPANNGLPDTCIRAIATFNNIIFAGTKNHGIYKSTDKGTNWMATYTGVPDTNISSLHACGVNIFAGILGQGFFMSPDTGQHWSSYNKGLMNYNINSITDNATDIFIGSNGYSDDGGGIWKKHLLELPLTFSVKEIEADHKIICEGNSTAIYATVIGGTPPYSYLWNNGNTTSSITVTPTTTTTYSLTTTDSKPTTVTSQITIHVNPLPPTPVLTQHGDTLFSSVTNGNVWMLNGVVMPYVNSNWFLEYQHGNYSVVVMKNGCISDTSNIIKVLGIDEFIIGKDINIYPNPTTGRFTLENKDLGLNIKGLEIYNVYGEKVYTCMQQLPTSIIDISSRPSGVYFLKIITQDGSSAVKKIIRE